MKFSIRNYSKKGWAFVLLVCILSVFPYIKIVEEGSTETSWTILLMWVPALAAIIMRLYNKEGIFKGITWNPFKGGLLLLLAIFSPLIIEILSLVITVGLGAAEFDSIFFSIDEGQISITGIAMLFGAAAQPWYMFIPNFSGSFLVGVVLYGATMAIGEEYGWRGYLQKEWIKDNKLVSFILLGVVWGFWHLPGVLLGHNYPDYPLLGGFVLMPLATTLFSIVFGIYYNKNRNIWIPIFFHSALNLSSEIGNLGMIEESVNKPVNDLVWTALWLCFAIFAWFGSKRNK